MEIDEAIKELEQAVEKALELRAKSRAFYFPLLCAMRKWRPPGWTNPYFLEDLGVGFYNEYPEFEVYEAGASSMLEAVREQLGKLAFLLDDIEIAGNIKDCWLHLSNLADK